MSEVQGMGTPPHRESVTHVLRICVTYVVRIFCYLCPGLVQFLGLSVVSPYLVKTEYFGTHDESAVALGCQRARTDSEISTRMITNQMMKAMFFFLNRLIASADTCPFSMSFSANRHNGTENL